MDTLSDPSMLLLHTLRVKGLAAAAAVSRSTGVPSPEVDELLLSLQRQGWVTFRARPTGWALTPAGREKHRRALAAELPPDNDVTEALHEGYRRFRSLDEPVKTICTAWQMRDLATATRNDHDDPGYDQAVIARLSAVHADAVEVVDDLARALLRFGSYRDRLDDAHRRVLAGDRDAITTPLSDSYHDVWMELHEDLLVSLGIERREGET